MKASLIVQAALAVIATGTQACAQHLPPETDRKPVASVLSSGPRTCLPVNITGKYVELAERHAPASDVKRLARTEDGAIYEGLLGPIVARDGFSSNAQSYYDFMSRNAGIVTFMAGALTGAASAAIEDFAGYFPRMKCTFRFYVAPTYGAINGAAYYANGTTRLVLAPETLARDGPLSLEAIKVLVDHELFHVYHGQASEGRFGPQAGDDRPLYQSIWSEGLATFVSGRLNKDVPLDALLFDKRLVPAVDARMKAIAEDLLPRLDSSSDADYARYCQGGTTDPLVPARAGYYIGYKLAQHLSRTMSLDDMARLPPDRVRTEMAKFLEATGRLK